MKPKNTFYESQISSIINDRLTIIIDNLDEQNEYEIRLDNNEIEYIIELDTINGIPCDSTPLVPGEYEIEESKLLVYNMEIYIDND